VSPIKTSIQGNVLRITLADPTSGNLLSDSMLGAIIGALDEGRDAQVVVINSDLADFSVGRPRPRVMSGLSESDATKVRKALDMVHSVNMTLRNWHGVSVAALRGQAKGAASGFLVNCDVVVAEPGATLGFPEITYDLPPAVVASYLPNRIPAKAAQYMLLTGQQIDMARALSWGIVHEVCVPEALNQRTEELVAFLSARAPGSLADCKAALSSFAFKNHAEAGPLGISQVIEWLSRPSL
jgi:enoyl-CoA hydratase/carnithine racemase